MGGIPAFDFTPQMRVLLRQLVLAAPQLTDELCGLDGDGGVRCQRSERILVANREYAGPLVQYFESPDNLAHLVPHRHGQHGARAVAGLAVDAAIEARIAVCIFHVDGVTSE